MKASFIRIAEIWLPNQDHSLLAFGGGLFGPAKVFAAATPSLRFGMGEGLPGLAWQEGHPILLKDFDSPHFLRAAEAQEASLGCAIALPLFIHGALKAIVVLFGGDEDARSGAIELWHNSPRVTTDMTLVDGYYGMASDSFEVLSKDTFLPRGTGLPGLAWQRGAAVFMENLGASPRFLRGATAAEAGITRGLALPCPTRTDDAYVLTLLSALGTPIAQKLESWAPDAQGEQLQRGFGFCETQGSLPTLTEGIPLSNARHPVVSAFQTGVPRIEGALIAIPVVADGEVAEVLTLHL
jgi:hypothetical protein